MGGRRAEVGAPSAGTWPGADLHVVPAVDVMSEEVLEWDAEQAQSRPKLIRAAAAVDGCVPAPRQLAFAKKVKRVVSQWPER